MDYREIIARAGVGAADTSGGGRVVRTPIDGSEIAQVREQAPAEVSAMVAAATDAFRAWRTVPAPRRGELVRLLGDELRAAKADLGRLVTLENGKILQEGLGEV